MPCPVFSSSHLSFLLLFFQKELFLLKRAPTKSLKKVGRPWESNPGLPDKKCRFKNSAPNKSCQMAVAAKLFAPDEELLQIWANFTEKSDEKCFTKFVKVSTSYPV